MFGNPQWDRPPIRADRTGIFTLNPEDWFSFAIEFGFGVRKFIVSIDQKIYY
jgi:hypothetical protein